jgi:hypothetical protein
MNKITESQCQEFLINPVLNPLTGRKIQKGKATYNQLMKECLKNIDAPSMGKKIHWRKDGVLEQDKNLLIMMNDVNNHIIKWFEEKETILDLSKMLVDECKELIKISRKHFKDNKKIIDIISSLEKKMKTIEQKHRIYDDVPKYNVIVNMEVKPSRVFNRGQVLNCYSLYRSTKRDMLSSIEQKKMTVRILQGNLQNVLNKKKYLDYLIDKKIFRYEDIYGKVFPNDKCFDELVEIFEEYKKFL